MYKMKVYQFIFVLIFGLSVLLISCSEPYIIELEGTWVNETTSFSIEKYQDDQDSFYVLTYLTGDYGTFTFDFKDYAFHFFIRRRIEVHGEFVYTKEYLSHQEVTFRMSYHVKTNKIHLLHLTLNAEPIIFSKLIEEPKE